MWRIASEEIATVFLLSQNDLRITRNPKMQSSSNQDFNNTSILFLVTHPFCES